MKKPCVLLSGKSVSRDTALIAELTKSAEVLSSHDSTSIDTVLKARRVDVIVLEVSGQHPGEAEIIRQIKARFPKIKIIFIDGGRELMARAFQHGAADAYRRPYRYRMLAERVKVLLEY